MTETENPYKSPLSGPANGGKPISVWWVLSVIVKAAIILPLALFVVALVMRRILDALMPGH